MRILQSKSYSIVLCEQQDAPRIIYFGDKLSSEAFAETFKYHSIAAIQQGSMDESPVLSIAPSLSEPTFMNPAIKMHCNGKYWAPQWHLFESESSDLHVTYVLADRKSGLVLKWTLTVYPDVDVLSIDSCLENKGSENIQLDQWLTTFPIPGSHSHAISFTGRWVHEFQPQYQELTIGALEWVNLKGRTSHDHFPGLLVTEPGVNELSGSALAFHLGWSGNHIQRLEKSQNGLVQYQAGIGFMPGEMNLKPGDHFEGATLYCTQSQTGYAGIAERLPTFVREHIVNFPDERPRPVHINTWEALYFNHNQEDLDSLASAAANVGAERYVLDDGWFLGRRDDRAGLGDWVIDKDVYPQGLHPLKETLRKQGLSFGLWFEPEMVNKRSELYKQHPEWVLELTDQHQASGRNQWVLDISRKDVQDYLITHICDVLRDYPIEYIKWDMNRDLLQAGNAQGKAGYYEYVCGLYHILSEIRHRYPKVEIESCSSGGGRMDYGILKYTHRFWLSDCNDAHERQIMQQWASLFFPSELLGSHVGPDVSHTTSRMHPLYVRAGTALFGHMGIEWDVRTANSEEKAQLKSYVELYKTLRTAIHSGVRRPLVSADKNQITFSVDANSETYVSIFQKTMPETAVAPALKIPNLKSNATYQVSVLLEPEKTAHLMKRKPEWMLKKSVQLQGELLSKIGLPLPVMDPESLFVFKLTEG